MDILNLLIETGIFLSPYTLILSFAVLGGGIKLIDNIFDENLFNKKIAYILFPFLVLIWMILSYVDLYTATILFAILFAVLVSGKIDNVVFRISALVLIISFVVNPIFSILWQSLILIVILGFLDEIGNDYSDKNNMNKIIKFFFAHRFLMKIGIFTLALVNIFPWIYFFAFLAFDASYELIGFIGNKSN